MADFSLTQRRCLIRGKLDFFNSLLIPMSFSMFQGKKNFEDLKAHGEKYEKNIKENARKQKIGFFCEKTLRYSMVESASEELQKDYKAFLDLLQSKISGHFFGLNPMSHYVLEGSGKHMRPIILMGLWRVLKGGIEKSFDDRGLNHENLENEGFDNVLEGAFKNDLKTESTSKKWSPIQGYSQGYKHSQGHKDRGSEKTEGIHCPDTVCNSENMPHQNMHHLLSVVVEYFHTASLLHDDVTDNSVMRRHKKTINALCGDKPGIILGDFFLGRALSLLAPVASPSLMEAFGQGTQKLAEGQMMEALYGKNWKHYTPRTYLKMIGKKTGALFKLSAYSAGLCFFQQYKNLLLCKKNHKEKIFNSLKRYGLFLGCAFQLRDDVLDFGLPLSTLNTLDRLSQKGKDNEHSAKEEGGIGLTVNWNKAIGKDFQERKPTYPVLWAYHYGSLKDKEILEELFSVNSRGDQLGRRCNEKKASFSTQYSDLSPKSFQKLQEFLLKKGAFQKTQDLGCLYGLKALKELDFLANEMNFDGENLGQRKLEDGHEGQKMMKDKKLLEKITVLSYTRTYS